MGNDKSTVFFLAVSTVSVWKELINEQGFVVINDVFDAAELKALIDGINAVDTINPLWRKTSELFAVRQFLQEVPKVKPILFNVRLQELVSSVFGDGYFAVKSMYFDKPPQSNWFVACHQDLTISVKERKDITGYGPWTVKHNQFAVQPPLAILEDNFTIRIHLDDTTKENGALKVIPGSHLKGIYRPETVDRNVEQEVYCEVEAGGIMIMRPLLLHASERTRNEARRRVVHVEFSRMELAEGLEWAEKCSIK